MSPELVPGGQGAIAFFENFGEGRNAGAASDAAEEYETASQTIEALPTSDAEDSYRCGAGIPQDEVASQVTDYFCSIAGQKRPALGSIP